MSQVKSYPLPSWARFYFYGMHGLLDEIVFTALFDFILKPEGNWMLKGYSTIFSFFIYGSCSFFVEQIYRYCVKHDYTIKHRLPIYILFIYVWEFTCGLVLRYFDACSWDYSHYRFNIMGLITLEYIPGWLFLCLWQDLVFYYLLSLRINLLFALPDSKIKS
ncbi:hypothetical protein SNE40_015351 [Patella caerulea]|uniref:Transmembrane protein 229A n=1 Tax=Patella caerulea TaxID=87958 RepID=A0AAN8JKF5_PATCE